ncbi:MAG: type I polyketide synthase, partial [Planctomycetales bacterium]|nr:type I polyketide synthase [Planctomycetales bacterium]
SITLIEAHGTGTSLGDPIEIESLSRVFRLTTDKRQYCAIGSLKTNVGHLDVAAGVAGLIKTSLALRNRVLPPSLNYEQPNPNIDFESSPFFVNTRLRDWETPFPRRAGLSSFGVGGTNAHLVIEEAPPLAATMAASPPQTAPQLILLSARSAAALDAQRLAIVQHLQDHPQLDMADVAFTLQTGRKTFNYSLAAVVNDLTQAIEVLREKPSQQVFEQRQLRRGKSVVFMFPGQGAQHLDMARDLYDSDKIFREVFDRCSELLLAHLGYDLREMVFLAAPDSTETAAERLNQTSVAQAAIFTVSYALAKRLQADGVLPSRMLGHSVGEFVAACLAGVFSLEEALRLIAFRAMHMQQLSTGSMLAVRMTEAEVLEKLPDELSLAAINGPQLCVVSGPSSTVEQWQQKLEAAEVVCRRLHTSHASHSAMMDPVVEPFGEQLRGVALRAPQLPIVSSVTGQPLTDAQAVDPNYWARHLRETVRFTDALAAITTDSAAVLLEVGPGPPLSTLARQHPGRNSEQ